MQHLEVSGAVRPLKWSLGVKGLNFKPTKDNPQPECRNNYTMYHQNVRPK